MIDVNNLRNGTTFLHDDNLFKVLEYSHNKPGRGKATIRTKVRNLRTGATIELTFNSGDRVQDVRLEHNQVQFLYRDDELVHFMDLETYEQPVLNASAIEEALPYLSEGLEVKLTTYENEPIDLELPSTVDLEVTEAGIAVRGDTSGAVTKVITTSNGLKVTVPQFVKEGDIIRINTTTGEYTTRVTN